MAQTNGALLERITARPVVKRFATVWLTAVCAAGLLGGCGTTGGDAGSSDLSPAAALATSPVARPATRASGVEAERQALVAALLAQMKHDARQQERARLTFGRADSMTKLDAVLNEEPKLRRLVRDYFDGLLRGGLPGDEGLDARRDLAGFFAPGSPALARACWLSKGAIAGEPDKALPDDFAFATLAMVHSLRLSRDRHHAALVVGPILGFWVYTQGGELVKGSLSRWDEDWDYLADEAPHRLTLVRRGGGGWRITDDFTLGDYPHDVASRLRRGGAPQAVSRAAADRIRRAVKRPVRLPTGVSAAFQRFIDLLNSHRVPRHRQPVRGREGLPRVHVLRSLGDGRYELRKVSGFASLSRADVLSGHDVPVVLDVGGRRSRVLLRRRRHAWLQHLGGTQDGERRVAHPRGRHRHPLVARGTMAVSTASLPAGRAPDR